MKTRIVKQLKGTQGTAIQEAPHSALCGNRQIQIQFKMGPFLRHIHTGLSICSAFKHIPKFEKTSLSIYER
jgi:hypothetical protein